MHPTCRECTPCGRARVQFWGNWKDLAVFRQFEVVTFFGEEKCTLNKILATPTIRAVFVRFSLAMTDRANIAGMEIAKLVSGV